MLFKSRVLFLLKRREDFNKDVHNTHGLSTGLYNSAKFIDTMLNYFNIVSNISVVVDGNDIDREVTRYKPTHAIIEALWVTPTKLKQLIDLHPNVTWIVRLHSELAFLAGEGIAMDWLGDYARLSNVKIACNSEKMLDDIRTFIQIRNDGWNKKQLHDNVIFLPNYYPQRYLKRQKARSKEFLDIGCFGAVRPLKNHLTQAIAALEFAEKKKKKLRFHINAGRVEGMGEPHIKNLKALFQHVADQGHKLIQHEWSPREDFLELCSSMDIGLQVSLSESFNIVGADYISVGVPLVGSHEIPWAHHLFCSKSTHTSDIVEKLEWAYDWPNLNTFLNRKSLTRYTSKVRTMWLKSFQ